MIVLLLALGFCKWSDWLESYFKFKFNFYGLLFIAPISFLFSGSLNKFNAIENYKSKYYPLKEIISIIRSDQISDKKETVIVIPSTPEVNQHNVSYLGRIQGGDILGRQLGQSLSHIKPVLEYSNWIILAEGDQGSVPSNSLVLDQSIRDSDLFIKIRQFPRDKQGSYSLWKRSARSLKPKEFHTRFIELAKSMELGPLGIKLIFDEIAIQHMLDGHFKYQNIVRGQALSKISSNPDDIESLWTLSLLNILSNRPFEADIYLKDLELLLPNNPWPSAYRTIVNLAAWNPWKASKIAEKSNIRHQHYFLQALSDLSAVLRGAFWRLNSTFSSLQIAVENVDKILKPTKK